MKNYEMMVIIKPDIGMDEIEKHLNSIKELVTSAKGDVTFEDQWGMRDIAYMIKKYDRGYYTVFNFSAEPELIAEMNNTLKLSNDVLRHLIITIPEGYEAKSYKDLEKEEEAEQEEKEEKKAPSKAKAPKKTVKAAPKEEKEEKKESAAKKEDGGSSLEDVDAKLKSIIDNPDLNF